MFYELTVNKYKIYAVQESGARDIDLTVPPNDGLDQLIERSLLAALNSVLSNQKPEPLPTTRKVRLLTYSGKGKEFNPYSNDYLWGEHSKITQ